jgi:NAD(P)-dependent dehydrogenase (short-subunit alcohol dehydrogenase family)
MADQRIALVTGASSGIGFATASLFAERGYRTFGTSRNPERKGGPKGVEMVKLDVDSDESARAAIDVVASKGPIQILINNAGFGLFGAVEETSLEEARRQVETNFWGAVRMTKLVLPGMRERRSGHIINISSVLGFIAIPFHAYYVAAKHALEGYSEALSLEVQGLGIRVALVEPSYIHTGFFDHRQEARSRIDAYRRDGDRVLQLMGERIRTGSDPDVVAGAVMRAVTAREPAFRYTAGFGGGILKVARSVLPTYTFDRVVRKSLALE